MVSPNKIKMVSNFNDEISMSDIFWREIMERKILWVPLLTCEKVDICLGVCVSIYFCIKRDVLHGFSFEKHEVIWGFADEDKDYNFQINHHWSIHSRIICGSADFFLFLFYRNNNVMVWNLTSRIWTLRGKKEIWLLFWWEVKSTGNTIWNHQNDKNWWNLYLLFHQWPNAWTGKWFEFVADRII